MQKLIKEVNEVVYGINNMCECKKFYEDADEKTVVGGYEFALPSTGKQCSVSVLNIVWYSFSDMASKLEKMSNLSIEQAPLLATLIYISCFKCTDIITVSELEDIISYYIEVGVFPEYEGY